MKESSASSNFGTNKWLELNDKAGSKRCSYLRFNITGIPVGATITKVEFFVTPNTEGGTAYPEYGDVDIYDVVEDSWDASVAAKSKIIRACSDITMAGWYLNCGQHFDSRRVSH